MSEGWPETTETASRNRHAAQSFLMGTPSIPDTHPDDAGSGLSRDQSERTAFNAGFKSWRLSKKSCQGSFFLRRSSKLPRLKSAGFSLGETSFHERGVETGACGAWRTQKGETTVCAKPLRKGSR